MSGLVGEACSWRGDSYICFVAGRYIVSAGLLLATTVCTTKYHVTTVIVTHVHTIYGPGLSRNHHLGVGLAVLVLQKEMLVHVTTCGWTTW